ncbi:MAG: hypothetical protein WA892_15005 [Ornithinimicrobium sp.]
MADLSRRMHSIHPDEQGVRWAHTPGRMTFLGVRELAVSYDDFVRRVDTSRVASLFRGVGGPAPHVLRADAWGRPLLQVEPRAVLALPIHSGYAGRVRSDVGTLERFDYLVHQRKVWLRTLDDSLDRPAQDALVTFASGYEGTLRLEVLTSMRYQTASLLSMQGADRRGWLRGHTSAYAFSCALTHLARRLQGACNATATSALA